MAHQAKQLKSWQAIKDLIDRHYKNQMTGRERGQRVIAANGLLPAEIFAGINATWFLGEAYAATVSYDPQLGVAVAEASEQRGFDRSICHYCKAYLGSMYLDRSFTDTGRFPAPDLCVTDCECTTHGKWLQRVAEHLHIPYFAFDHPYWSDSLSEHYIAYYIDQLYEFMDWLEKATGEKWDEGKFLRAQSNAYRVKRLWSDITSLQRNVPAPLDMRMMATLYTPAVHIYLEPEAVEVYEQLLDEVRERVTQGIAANPNERYRLAYFMAPQWRHLRDLRYIEQYGAVFVGSPYLFWWGSDWWERPDGSIGRPEWVGKEPRDLKEAFRWVAERTLGHPWRLEPNLKVVLKMIHEYHIDAVVLHATRGCEAWLRGWEYLRGPLEKMGIPCLVFEGSMADARDYSSSQVTDRIDAFLESQGLKRLEATA